MADGLTEFEKQLIYSAFYKQVNMSPREIEHRVGVEEEKPAEPAPESIDTPVVADASPALPFTLTEEQRIGRQLVVIKRKKKEEITDDDYVLMRKCVNYIRKHADKPPKNEEKEEEWAEGLRVWGYDPRKAKAKAETNDSPTE